MATIYAKDGEEILVSDEDFAELSKYVWSVTKDGYAGRYVPKSEGRKTFNGKMHRHIMGEPDGLEVDHINRNRLDNRRENLRIATRSQNQANTGTYSNNRLGVRGVREVGRKYEAGFTFNGKKRFVGLFKTLEEAKEALRLAHLEAHGEFSFAAQEK